MPVPLICCERSRGTPGQTIGMDPHGWMVPCPDAYFRLELVSGNNKRPRTGLVALRMTLEKDLILRRWTTEQGGVYVPITDKTPPNPYLKNVQEQNLITPSDRHLTLINPAYMMRQIHEMAWEEHGIYSRLTSLNPINPANRADPWEGAFLETIAVSVASGPRP